MPERQSLHPDNDLIDAAEETSVPTAQADRGGGNVNRRVGTRGELARATDPENREPETGSDNPGEDAAKGPKSIDHMVGGGSSPSR